MPSDAATGAAPGASSPQLPGTLDEPVDAVVRAVGIVVEEHQLAGVRAPGELDGVSDARMAPAHPRRVLRLAELAVVEEEVDALRERVPGDPLRLEVRELDAEDGLVVGDVRQRAAVHRESVAERRPGMGDRLRVDPDALDLPRLVRHVVEGHVRRRVGELDREERRRERPRDPLLERVQRRGRAPDVQLPVPRARTARRTSAPRRGRGAGA